jgi:hypothetical protein
MKNSDNIYKYIKYGIVFITFASIAFNSSTWKFFSRLSEIYDLKKRIEKVKIENETYKKRLNNLKTNSREMEKVVKMDVGDSNLGVLAENEIEYIFVDTEERNSQ